MDNILNDLGQNIINSKQIDTESINNWTPSRGECTKKTFFFIEIKNSFWEKLNRKGQKLNGMKSLYILEREIREKRLQTMWTPNCNLSTLQRENAKKNLWLNKW